MCGICGFVSKKEERPDFELQSEMLDRLYHRGPDGRGRFRDNQASIGHTRLSIIDLENGTQPMSNEDESLWISFNGEIYNYLELREELIGLGHVFKTRCDTEVIVHAWESWREQCFSRFNGQWAIALWDRKRQEMVLSRDRHGIRPLYYTENGKRFLFASEIKALFADTEVRRSLSRDGLHETYAFWGPLAPRTVFEKIWELPPGHYGIYKAGLWESFPYWSIQFPEGIDKTVDEKYLNDVSHELRERMDKAAKLRFERSDVPVGSYLSGGIDSSICASIANQYAKEGLKTFSLRFTDSQFDEGFYQKSMVDRLGTDHVSLMVEPSDIGAVFPKVIRQTERPILRTAPAPLFLLSRLVRESGYKVVVTGEGADEVLGGYDIFREAYVRKIIAEKGACPETEKLLGKLYPWMGDSFKRTPAFTRSFFSKNLKLDDPLMSHRPRWDNFRVQLPLLTVDMSSYVKNRDVSVSLIEHLPGEFNKWSSLAKAQWIEYTTLLSGYILSAQGDRMLMANSIEGRFPFLDVELVEFANGLSPEAKLRTADMMEKLILKEAYANELPKGILTRPKQPYQSPNVKSFFSSGENCSVLSWIDEILDPDLVREAGIYNPLAVRKILKKCQDSENHEVSHGDNTRFLSIISTMLVFKQFIKENDFQNQTISGDWKSNEICIDFCS